MQESPLIKNLSAEDLAQRLRLCIIGESAKEGSMNQQELNKILELHKNYLNGDPEGVKANMSGAYLSGANLSGAYLPGANLSRAYLSGANLSGAYLPGANLSRADLSGANLSRANLSRANLSRADLSGTNLCGAYLSGANLFGADLYEADLSGVYLFGANLYGAKNFVCFLNLKFPVYVFEHATLIGCKYNSNKEWLKIYENVEEYMEEEQEFMSEEEIKKIVFMIRSTQ